MNAYAVLGLEDGADKEQIRTAYRKLVKECHPDRHGDTQDNRERFARLTEAYDALIIPKQHFKTDSSPDAVSMVYKCVIPLTLSEVYTGAIREVKGQVFLIAAGYTEGDKITHSLSDTTILNITFKLKDDPAYKARGRDLYCSKEVTRRSVRKNGYVTLRHHPSWLSTLKNEKAYVPKDAVDGQVVRVTALGLPDSNKVRGDLYLTLQFKSHWYFLKQFAKATPRWVYVLGVMMLVALFDVFEWIINLFI